MLLCPICKQPVYIPENKDFGICCGETIIKNKLVKIEKNALNKVLDSEKTMKIAFDGIRESLKKIKIY
jgi:hypothetical protein